MAPMREGKSSKVQASIVEVKSQLKQSNAERFLSCELWSLGLYTAGVLRIDWQAGREKNPGGVWLYSVGCGQDRAGLGRRQTIGQGRNYAAQEKEKTRKHIILVSGAGQMTGSQSSHKN